MKKFEFLNKYRMHDNLIVPGENGEPVEETHTSQGVTIKYAEANVVIDLVNRGKVSLGEDVKVKDGANETEVFVRVAEKEDRGFFVIITTKVGGEVADTSDLPLTYEEVAEPNPPATA